MSSVRNVISFARHPRFFGAALVTCAIPMCVACHSGVETPVSPTIEGLSVPTASSTALAGGPMDFTMAEVEGSGFSGTCTLGTGGAGFRIKASGQGHPGRDIRFILEIKVTETNPRGGRYTDVARVDDRGNFRTGGERVTYIPSGSDVYCAVLEEPGAAVLAQGDDFKIP